MFNIFKFSQLSEANIKEGIFVGPKTMQGQWIFKFDDNYWKKCQANQSKPNSRQTNPNATNTNKKKKKSNNLMDIYKWKPTHQLIAPVRIHEDVFPTTLTNTSNQLKICSKKQNTSTLISHNLTHNRKYFYSRKPPWIHLWTRNNRKLHYYNIRNN